MAERLTKKITKTIQDKYSLGSYLYYDFNGAENTNRLLNKLGKLEDIMEKYGIESVEELDYLLEVFKKMRKEYGKLNQENCKSKKQLNTWKRACELACEIIISGCCDCIEDTTDWDSAVEEWKEYNGIETYGIGVEELLGYLLEQAKTEGSDE